MEDTSLQLLESDLLDLAKTRAFFCRFLNIPFKVLPDMNYVDDIREDAFGDFLKALYGDDITGEEIRLGAKIMNQHVDATRNQEKGQVAECLGIDRARIYSGISPDYGPPAPCETLWRKGQEDTDSLQDVVLSYRHGGFELKKDEPGRPDHISVELDYMAQVASKEISTLEAGDSAGGDNARKSQEAFLREHMSRWVPEFVRKAIEYAETDFYRGHLHMLSGFVTGQTKALGQIVNL